MQETITIIETDDEDFLVMRVKKDGKEFCAARLITDFAYWRYFLDDYIKPMRGEIEAKIHGMI